LELFEIADHAVEIAAHLLDLRGDRPALRGERREKCEESLAGAATFVGLCNGAIEVGLLFGNGVLGALDLFGAHRVDGALGQGGKLAFKPYANRI
ncbi:MAG TPA: hypothetical protein VM910_12725, partial [Bradyrhizobium sp.]|nr:hypothetical protein [Bradyrhizobium sp.]